MFQRFLDILDILGNLVIVKFTAIGKACKYMGVLLPQNHLWPFLSIHGSSGTLINLFHLVNL